MTAAEFNLSVGRVTTLACLLEVTAPKPGNVHRGADFEDLAFGDFMVSAVMVGEVFDRAGLSVGELVLEAVRATQENVGTNTNLGIVLLIAPLVAVLKTKLATDSLFRGDVEACLQGLTTEDGRKIYAAIQLAQPGGMGEAGSQDVNDAVDDVDLMAAMKASQGYDSIARQYANGFEDIFGVGQMLLRQGRQLFPDLNSAIVFAHVAWMAQQTDTLIQRKCGKDVAKQSQTMARRAIDVIDPECLASGAPLAQLDAESFWQRVGELDFWLRSDGHRRNPGTTADLIAATLFVAIWNGDLRPPFRKK
jgi:triphosphoribosyl-dephospho-CoA synthase